MRIFYILMLISFFCLPANASKTSDKDEFENLFKAYADSTLIFSGVVPFSTGPDNRFIVSKKGDTVSLFIYHYDRHDIDSYPELPDSLAKYISNKKYPRTAPGVGPYFEVQKISQEKGAKLWQALINEKPWELLDDSVYGSGCEPLKKVHRKSDGSTVTEERLGQHDLHSYFLKLITKEETKHLQYYAPEVLEKACPGKEGRQHIVVIKQLLLRYFQKGSVFWNTSGHPSYKETPVVDYFQ
ncbi:hypothetical protein [Olivibacter domesticus]|uniref:Uncharacterized protein n=1 Tax=Olivibacter domesticus TaxID=407022 RepID=A0A1H7WQI1_OLID1|nr:hypothetical protein [Olivibacter domesticus]SEM23752.1 hypothetical protein SAMN05661044_04616 [Olivibacter domesticus]